MYRNRKATAMKVTNMEFFELMRMFINTNFSHKHAISAIVFKVLEKLNAQLNI